MQEDHNVVTVDIERNLFVEYVIETQARSLIEFQFRFWNLVPRIALRLVHNSGYLQMVARKTTSNFGAQIAEAKNTNHSEEETYRNELSESEIQFHG